MIKNWLDVCIGALVYWATGFAFTFGESVHPVSRVVGTSYFFFYDMPGKAPDEIVQELISKSNFRVAQQSYLQLVPYLAQVHMC